MLKVMELLLEPNNVKEECKFSIDSKLVTFHKMRLINKEFNRRMKLKILTLDHLNLDFILREGIINTDFNLLRNELILKKLKLWKLMNLLKHQRIYNEYKKNIDCNNGHIMKTILQLDHVSLYNNEPFDNFFNENKNNSTLHFTEFDFIPLIDRASSVDFDSNNDYELIDYEEEEDDTLEKEEKKFIDVNSLDIFELSNKDLNDLEQQLTKDFKNLQSKEKSNNSKRITFEKTIEDPEYSQSYYNASPVGFLLTSNHFYPYPSSNALKPKITEFIGDNNTVKSIQFNCNLFNSYILKEDLKLMLNCLKNLTTINYINYNESINAHPFRTTPTNISSLPSVKEVNIIFIDNYQFSFVTSLVKSQEIQQFENLERINIFPLYDNGLSDLKEAVKSELQPIIQSVYSETTVNNSFVFIEKNPITNENIVYYKNNNENNNTEKDNRQIELCFTLLPNFRKEDWIWLTTNYLQTNNDIINSGFLKCLNSMNLKMKKWLLEYWIKNNYLLVEDIIPYLLTVPNNNETLCIIQYLIYLSNEYHNGRLFNGLNLLHNMDYIPFLRIIKYGFTYEKQITELFLLFNITNLNQDIISLLVQLLPFGERTTKEDMIDEFVQTLCLQFNNTFFIEHILQSLYQQFGMEVMKKILLHPVCCFLDGTLNLIYFPFLLTLYHCNSYFIIDYIYLFETKELLSIKDEIDNNICQLFISLDPQDIDNHFILKIIEKVPELAYTKNKEGETLLHTCCFLLKSDVKKANLIYYLIKENEVPYDQPDNKGRTVKQLLEERNPSLYRLLFQNDKVNPMATKRKYL